MSLNLKTETERAVDALQSAGVDVAAGALNVASRTVDRSPAAVSRRLEALAQLYEMAHSLKRARVVGQCDLWMERRRQ
ncbi:MAG: hypothetical protein R3A52_02195 [Polyangiales bacterium]